MAILETCQTCLLQPFDPRSIYPASTHLSKPITDSRASQIRTHPDVNPYARISIRSSYITVPSCRLRLHSPSRSLLPENGTRVDTSIPLFAVTCPVESGEAPAEGLTISREKKFLYDKHGSRATFRPLTAWQRCSRACMVSLKGVTVEASVPSVMHQITCFPPAVRSRKCLLCLILASYS
jgi:hypothetical protein